MVLSAAIHVKLKLYFNFPLRLYFPMGDRKKWSLVDGPADFQRFPPQVQKGSRRKTAEVVMGGGLSSHAPMWPH